MLIPLSCRIEELEISWRRTLAASPSPTPTPFPVLDVDALSRYALQVPACDPHPDYQFRDRFREVAVAKCGAMAADMMACEDGFPMRGARRFNHSPTAPLEALYFGRR